MKLGHDPGVTEAAMDTYQKVHNVSFTADKSEERFHSIVTGKQTWETIFTQRIGMKSGPLLLAGQEGMAT